MKKDMISLFALIATVICPVLAGDVSAQNPPPAAPPPVQNPLLPGVRNSPTPDRQRRSLQEQGPPVIEKVSPGIFRIGEILINKKERSISFPAAVNMEKGLLEYLLVRTGGKTHESLLRTDVEPYPLQIAFLLLGYEGTDRPLTRQGAPELPKGEPVRITISRSGDKNGKLDYERWICRKNESGDCEVPRLEWVYTGSVVMEGRFYAQLDGSIVALYHDPYALMDTTTAGSESDRIWFVKEDAVPPAGTAVTVTIQPKQ